MHEILLSPISIIEDENISQLFDRSSDNSSSAIDHILLEDGVISVIKDERDASSLMLATRESAIEFETISIKPTPSFEQANNHKFSIEVLGKIIRKCNIQQLHAILLNFEVSIIDLLEIRRAKDQATGLRIICIAEAQNESTLKNSLSQLSHDSKLDINITNNINNVSSYQLVCFDMDSTLIQVEVIDELAKHAGVGNRVAEITERAMRGEIDFRQSFIERMALLKGLDEQTTALVADKIPLTTGVEKLLQNLKSQGIKTAILSGGFDYFANRLKEKLGFDYVYANKLEAQNGMLTGRTIEPIVDAQFKADSLVQIARQLDIPLDKVVAVGDGANDLKMMSVAGLGIAFNAKPLVKQAARCSISFNDLDAVLYLMGHTDPNLFA